MTLVAQNIAIFWKVISNSYIFIVGSKRMQDNTLKLKMEQINSTTYSFAAIKQLYTNQKWLPVEASLLLDFADDIKSKKVLELGAGSGRIASMLIERTSEYFATDINHHMVSTLREVHPGVKSAVIDARDMSDFPDDRFDTVIFSFNGLDCLPFAERSKALSEIFRIIKPGGAFIHSTHNVSHAELATHKPTFASSNNSIVEYSIRLWNRLKLSRYEYFSSEYAIVNDRALKNGLLNVYVNPEIHFDQLKKNGFSIDAVYERNGRRLKNNERPTDQWFYIVARN